MTALPAEPRRTVPESVQIAEAISDLIGTMVQDVLEETRRRIQSLSPQDADDIRNAREPVCAFSPVMETELKALRSFLHDRLYRHHKVNRVRSQSRRIVKSLFEVFLSEPDTLPPEWLARYERGGHDDSDEVRLARVVCDYIAGMTDRYAICEYRRLFDVEFSG